MGELETNRVSIIMLCITFTSDNFYLYPTAKKNIKNRAIIVVVAVHCMLLFERIYDRYNVLASNFLYGRPFRTGFFNA